MTRVFNDNKQLFNIADIFGSKLEALGHPHLNTYGFKGQFVTLFIELAEQTIEPGACLGATNYSGGRLGNKGPAKVPTGTSTLVSSKKAGSPSKKEKKRGHITIEEKSYFVDLMLKSGGPILRGPGKKEVWGPSYISHIGTPEVSLDGWKLYGTQGELSDVLSGMAAEICGLERPPCGKTARSWISFFEARFNGDVEEVS